MPESLTPNELAMLDALGEASPEEKAALFEACRADPLLAEEHRRLLLDVQMMDLLVAPKRNAPVPTMPQHVLERLEQSRREFVAQLQAEQARESKKVVVLPTDINSRATAEKEGAASRVVVTAPRVSWSRRLAIAAVVAIFAGLAGVFFFSPKKPQPAAVVFSPVRETGLPRPALVWENRGDQLYDVWILPAEGEAATVPPLFVANQVRSPVAFSDLKPKTEARELQPGRDYRLLVCLNIDSKANRLAGVATPFRVAAGATTEAPAPTTPEAALSVLRRLVGAGRPGDAVAVFAALPGSLRTNPELAAYEAGIRNQIRREQTR